MADVMSAIAYVLRQEDSCMSGAVTNDPRDSGGRTRFGIAERFHPELTATGYFDAMPYGDALKIANDTYAKGYAAPLSIGAIKDQQTANAVLSFAINEGTDSSVKVLQQALHSIEPSVGVDGNFGPGTLAAVNNCGPSTLLTLLGVFQKQHYVAIVAATPKDSAFLNGWLNRVTQNCKAA